MSLIINNQILFNAFGGRLILGGGGYSQMHCCGLQVNGLIGGSLQYSIKLESTFSFCEYIGGEAVLKFLKCRWHLLGHEFQEKQEEAILYTYLQ